MLQPWEYQPNHMVTHYSNESNIRDYLFPNLLAFIKTKIPCDIQDKVNEIRLIRSPISRWLINHSQLNIYICVDVPEADLALLTTELTETFRKYLSSIGLIAKTVVYRHEGLHNISLNKLFAEEIYNNSILLWSCRSEANVTVKSCIDFIYESFIADGVKKDISDDYSALNEFILQVPRLDWLGMQRAMQDAPVNYSELPSYIYDTVANHIRIWCTEFHLHMPEWIGKNPFCNPFPLDEPFDRNNL